MDWTPLTDDMRRFILMNIPSVPYLEALLLMRSDENHLWGKEDISQRLFINDSNAKDLLVQMYESGIIETVNPDASLFRYHPRSEEIKKMINQLADVYAKNLIEVANLIHSKKAQKFADAFIWKKGK